jgi:hypothetical protein
MLFLFGWLFVFETGFCYVAQAGLKFAILLLHLPDAEITGMNCHTQLQMQPSLLCSPITASSLNDSGRLKGSFLTQPSSR